MEKPTDFIHNQKHVDTSLIRESVFGMEDGMVSTFGAVTGIAASTADPFTVLLAGTVIIAVESISMGVGSYLSNKSEREMNERKLQEERFELRHYPEEERKELFEMYMNNGWPEDLARQMTEVASKNKTLFLQEMALHELKVFPETDGSPQKNALAMFVSYIFGGAIPLLPYFFFSVEVAIPVSIGAALLGLFALGVATTKYSKRVWWKAGFEMLFLAAAAGAVGYVVGQLVESKIGR